MTREQKNVAIKKCFDLLAGVKINQGSFVVRWMDNKIYLVLARDSKNAECQIVIGTGAGKKEIFPKKELCRFDFVLNRYQSLEAKK